MAVNQIETNNQMVRLFEMQSEIIETQSYLQQEIIKPDTLLVLNYKQKTNLIFIIKETVG